VTTATAPQRYRVRRALLLFALLAAVFAMHSLDATHAAATPVPSVTAPMAMNMAMDMPMPGMPEHSTDNACHDMAQMAGGCLALLGGAIALGALRRQRVPVARRASRPAQPTARPTPTPRHAAPPGPPDLAVLSICRT
jgi:hypothetical protein